MYEDSRLVQHCFVGEKDNQTGSTLFCRRKRQSFNDGELVINCILMIAVQHNDNKINTEVHSHAIKH